jgi:hypothetical protein
VVRSDNATEPYADRGEVRGVREQDAVAVAPVVVELELMRAPPSVIAPAMGCGDEVLSFSECTHDITRGQVCIAATPMRLAQAVESWSSRGFASVTIQQSEPVRLARP